MSSNVVSIADYEERSTLAEVYNQYPMELVRAKGVYCYDEAGEEYLDFYGGHCVTPIGHSPKEVVDAIAEQGSKFMFYSNLARIPIRQAGAKALIDFADNGLKKAFFCNSGAEANENALKIAIKATGRSKVIGFSGAFHGRTMLAVGATDIPAWHEAYRGWLGEVVRIKPNELSGLSSVDEETAAVILEPIQSIGGVTEFEYGYLRALREACDRVGAKLIFDEVQTGMGRTGTPFVSGWCGVLPDMMTLAKGLASGFPIGAVVMTEQTAEQVEKGDIAATFGGGPMAIAAMMATIKTIVEKNLPSRAKEMEKYIREKFQLPQVKEIRGQGLLLGLVLDREAKPVQEALFKKGIITGTNSNPQLLHLLPALTIEEQHVDRLHEALVAVIA